MKKILHVADYAQRTSFQSLYPVLLASPLSKLQLLPVINMCVSLKRHEVSMKALITNCNTYSLVRTSAVFLWTGQYYISVLKANLARRME